MSQSFPCRLSCSLKNFRKLANFSVGIAASLAVFQSQAGAGGWGNPSPSSSVSNPVPAISPPGSNVPGTGTWNPTITYTWLGGGQPPSTSYWLLKGTMYSYGTSATGSISPYGILSSTTPWFSEYTINQLVQQASGSFSENFTANNANGFGCLFSVAPDRRAAMITSSVEPSYSKTGPDVRASDGTMTVDTTAPDPPGNLYGLPTNGGTESITYTGIASGSWGKGSYSNLNSSMTGQNAQGYFAGSGAVSTLAPSYSGNIAGAKEHVYLHLTDGADGASATSNYYVNFHAPLENRTTTQTIVFPQNPVGFDPTDDTTWGEFGYITDSPNPGKTAVTVTLAQNVEWSVQNSASLGANASAAWLAFTFGSNYNESISETYSGSTSASYPVTIPPGGTGYWFGAASGTRLIGSGDAYGGNGYTGTGYWNQVTYSQLPSIFGIPWSPASSGGH